MSRAPSSSASYSRVREIASWIIIAAIGARNTRAIAPIGLFRLPPPKNSRNWATDVIMPATAAATDEVRMSRL